jgi:transmembrane sensor
MTAPTTPPDWDAIARYLAGESDAAETVVVRAWLEAHPADRALIERLDAAAIDAVADVDVEAALARVHQRIGAPIGAARPSLKLERGGATAAPRRRGTAVMRIGGLAAAAAVAFMLTRARAPETPTPSSAVQHYATGVGKTYTVTLPDSSRVVLGPQSTLAVPGTFDAGDRTVTLTGDAYFDVRHDASRPFRVNSGSAVIEDLGTTFTIESDAASLATVSVVEGSVRLSRTDVRTEPVVLRAGDRGVVERGGVTRVEENVVRAEDTEWISGRLAFRDAPLSRVAAEMERWYGLKVRVADSSMLGRKVTTSFEGESADKALQILELTIGAKITRAGDSVIIANPPAASTSR